MAAMHEEFLAVHKPQLNAINFPTSLNSDLFERLQQDQPDNTNESDLEIKTFPNSRSMLIAKTDIKINSTFYLIEHLWTCDGGKKAYTELKRSPQLAEELASLLRIQPLLPPEESFDRTRQVDVLSSLSNSTKSDADRKLKDNDSDTIAALVELIDDEGDEEDNVEQAKEKKKENEEKEDKCSFEEFKSSLKSSGKYPADANETYLEKMYDNFLLDGDGFGSTMQYNWTDDGNTLTVFVSIPGSTKKQSVKSTLTVRSWKLIVGDQEIVNGEFFQTVKPDECLWSIETPGVLTMILEKVHVGNLWAELIKAEVQLSSSDIISTAWLKDNGDLLYLHEILDEMWHYNQTYSIMSDDGVKKKPVWYIMDKYGSALTHAPNPNFQCSPFFHVTKGKKYSLLWPIKDITKGSVCTRNFTPKLIQHETHQVCKARLKAFTGNKIHKKLEPITPSEEKKENQYEEVEVVYLEDVDTTVHSEESNTDKSVFLSVYTSEASEKVSTKLKIVENNNDNVDISIIPLKDKSIKIDSNVLPLADMIFNKDYMGNYLQYQLGNCDWLPKTYILPRDLDEFNMEFECSNLPQFWIVKQVDSRIVDVETVITSSYSRIARMCEAGHTAVSRYIVDQPRFRHRRFALNYSVVLNTSNDTIFIYKEPLVRQTQEDYYLNSVIDEYDTSLEITQRPQRLVADQDKETYKDFQVAMNKLLLPKDPDRGWVVYQNSIFQRIGIIAKIFLKDIERDTEGFVLFGVELVIDWDLEPIVVDINGLSNLPNKKGLQDLLELVDGNVQEHFVKII